MPVSAFQSPNVIKSEICIGENTKYLDAILNLPATSTKMKGVCKELLPRLMHALNLVLYALSVILKMEVLHSLVCLMQAAKGPVGTEQNAALYNLVLEALGHMSSWKSSFLLFLAAKYQVSALTGVDEVVSTKLTIFCCGASIRGRMTR